MHLTLINVHMSYAQSSAPAGFSSRAWISALIWHFKISVLLNKHKILLPEWSRTVLPPTLCCDLLVCYTDQACTAAGNLCPLLFTHFQPCLRMCTGIPKGLPDLEKNSFRLSVEKPCASFHCRETGGVFCTESGSKLRLTLSELERKTSLGMLHTILMFCELSASLSIILPEDAFAFFFIFLTKCYVS